MTPVTPDSYRRIFEGNKEAAAILDHLTLQFWRNPYSESDRDTAYKAGQMSVIDYINSQINEANNGQSTGVSR